MTTPHRRQPTRNRMGWTSNQPNELSQRFIGYCRSVALPVLDLGAAYGVATIPALQAGATVIANDVDSEHLATLQQAVPEALLGGLRLLPGHFPSALELAPGSLGAIHASNLLHFLTGEEIEAGAAKMHRWLTPGGCVFIHAGTPYQAPFQRFIAEFEARTAAGDPWPGYAADTRKISDHKRLAQIPPAIHLLDPAVLTRVFAAAGFVIERAGYYRRRDLPRSLHLDGREGVALLAVR